MVPAEVGTRQTVVARKRDAARRPSLTRGGRPATPSIVPVMGYVGERKPQAMGARASLEVPFDSAALDAVVELEPDGSAVVSGERLEHAAVISERHRIARELHDGVLQSLTGAALQLEAMLSLVECSPEDAHERLRDLQQLIVDEQRELRRWVDSLRRQSGIRSCKNLPDSLATLCRHVSHCGLQVELLCRVGTSVPARLRHHVYRLVQEGLSNIARHAHAEHAWVEVRPQRDRIEVVLEDNGKGFSFLGRFELATLRAGALGPVSLIERVDSLAGTLVLTSTPGGSRIEISIPSVALRCSAPPREPGRAA